MIALWLLTLGVLFGVYVRLLIVEYKIEKMQEVLSDLLQRP